MTSEWFIVGLDEVGRGALAGPVVAGACRLGCELVKAGTAVSPYWHPAEDASIKIADSKKLSPEARERASLWLTEHCHVGIGWCDASLIDEIGIKPATHRAMLQALESIRSRGTVSGILIDGRDGFRFDEPHQEVIKGDLYHPQIAAASVVAKVYRDALMSKLELESERYGFAGHKGYGSQKHIDAIRLHGPSHWHRQSFLGFLRKDQMALFEAS